MAAYTVINARDSQLTDVDGSTDVAPHSYKNGITLTNTQVAAACSTQGVFVTSDLTGVADAEQVKRIAGLCGAYLSA